jgi:hypothetical protein
VAAPPAAAVAAFARPRRWKATRRAQRVCRRDQRRPRRVVRRDRSMRPPDCRACRRRTAASRLRLIAIAYCGRSAPITAAGGTIVGHVCTAGGLTSTTEPPLVSKLPDDRDRRREPARSPRLAMDPQSGAAKVLCYQQETRRRRSQDNTETRCRRGRRSRSRRRLWRLPLGRWDRSLSGNASCPPRINQMEVSAAGQSMTYKWDTAHRQNARRGAYDVESWEFQATGPTALITFQSLDQPASGTKCGPVVTNISVTAAVSGGSQ